MEILEQRRKQKEQKFDRRKEVRIRRMTRLNPMDRIGTKLLELLERGREGNCKQGRR